MSLSDDDGLEMPAREGWFPVGTDSPVGLTLMIESAGVVAKRAPEKLGDGTRKGELSGLEIWR